MTDDTPAIIRMGDLEPAAGCAGWFPSLPPTPAPLGYEPAPLRPKTVRQRFAVTPGQRFGKLVAIDRIATVMSTGRYRQIWRFACDCGRVVERRSDHVRKDRECHCGCSPIGGRPVR